MTTLAQALAAPKAAQRKCGEHQCKIAESDVRESTYRGAVMSTKVSC